MVPASATMQGLSGNGGAPKMVAATATGRTGISEIAMLLGAGMTAEQSAE